MYNATFKRASIRLPAISDNSISTLTHFLLSKVPFYPEAVDQKGIN